MYDPQSLTIPKKQANEHDKNPPHFQKTQEVKPDFSDFKEEDGSNCHGFSSHLHDEEILAENIATYYGMISLMDKQIGAILDKLDGLGLTDNTMVLFTTDHGHLYGHHGLIAKGAFHYEDMIKIPMIAKLPGTIPAGVSSDSLQSIVDVAPTFLAAAGIDIPRCMTGLNMLPEWSGHCDALRDHIICENRHQPTKLHLKTYVNERYKITIYYGRDYGELFDLQEDPKEINNLWNEADFQSLKAELCMKYIHAELIKEPLPMPRIAGA
jgi:uncharacterized sulfatase